MTDEREVNTTTVRMNKLLKEKIERWLQTHEAAEMGLHTIADVIDTTTRDWINKHIEPMAPTCEHFYMQDRQNPEKTLNLNIYADHVLCNICKNETCEHIQRLYDDKRVIDIITEVGISIPEKKNDQV